MLNRACRSALVGVAALLVPIVAAREARGQSGDDQQTRQLWDDAFKKKRAEAKSAPARRQSEPNPPERAAPPAEHKDDASFVGVTVWRLRPVKAGGGPQGAVVASAEGVPLTAERVEVGTSFAPGDRVRLGIESARPGFLYLIDREQYAGGTLGDPYLIFPRSRIRGGDNRVGGGRLVEIPDLLDTPPYFTMKSSRADHTGDLLTVLLAPEPLRDLPVGRNAVKLSRDQVEEWERKWAAPLKKVELAGGAGSLYTAAERDAAGTTSRLLTQEDPVPQTLYRIEAKQGEPLLLNIPLGTKRQP